MNNKMVVPAEGDSSPSQRFLWLKWPIHFDKIYLASLKFSEQRSLVNKDKLSNFSRLPLFTGAYFGLIRCVTGILVWGLNPYIAALAYQIGYPSFLSLLKRPPIIFGMRIWTPGTLQYKSVVHSGVRPNSWKRSNYLSTISVIRVNSSKIWKPVE